ncbi:heme NO-binding domain-containing protein [Paracoccus thiocyanatus]|uniref:Haem-NO-binding n=1 Tax=Paracoccus thiocyanatus TaxID=34006 RepID=A0A1N6YZY8_9RHOB|nr:heme NO-binding domain-containing protein [Paracoccus thiocyanatus]RDW13663.1 heme NO-binding protein [Paracoccus thiocyanatus]SIR20117.1 Haem-NO-binding [Paracoccus thiocyanatus]
MHGLVNRCLEAFLRSSYGNATWQKIAAQVDIHPDGFLTWEPSPDRVTHAMVIAAARRLGKSVGELLEDVGAWLSCQEQIRRLLRFGGSNFPEFVESLRELPGRVELVIPDLAFPGFAVLSQDAGRYRIHADAHAPGLMRVLAGMLRVMADDYGALAVISVVRNRIDIEVVLPDYSDKRGFELSPAGGRR